MAEHPIYKAAKEIEKLLSENPAPDSNPALIGNLQRITADLRTTSQRAARIVEKIQRLAQTYYNPKFWSHTQPNAATVWADMESALRELNKEALPHTLVRNQDH